MISRLIQGSLLITILYLPQEGKAYDLFKYLRTPFQVKYHDGKAHVATQDGKKLEISVAAKQDINLSLGVTLILHAARVPVDFLYPAILRIDDGQKHSLSEPALYLKRNANLLTTLIRPKMHPVLPPAALLPKDTGYQEQRATAKRVLELVALAYAFQIPPQSFRIQAQIAPGSSDQHIVTLNLLRGYNKGLIYQKMGKDEYFRNIMGDAWAEWALKNFSDLNYKSSEAFFGSIIKNYMALEEPLKMAFGDSILREQTVFRLKDRLQTITGLSNITQMTVQTPWVQLPDPNTASTSAFSTLINTWNVERGAELYHPNQSIEFYKSLAEKATEGNEIFYGVEHSNPLQPLPNTLVSQTGLRNDLHKYVFLIYENDAESGAIAKVVDQLNLQKRPLYKKGGKFTANTLQLLLGAEEGTRIRNLQDKTLVLFEPRFDSDAVYERFAELFPNHLIFDHHGDSISANDRWSPLSTFEQFAKFLGYELNLLQRAVAIKDRSTYAGLREIGISTAEDIKLLNKNIIESEILEKASAAIEKTTLGELNNRGNPIGIYHLLDGTADASGHLMSLRDLHFLLQDTLLLNAEHDSSKNLRASTMFTQYRSEKGSIFLSAPHAQIQEIVDAISKNPNISYYYFGDASHLQLTISAAKADTHILYDYLFNVFESTNEADYRKILLDAPNRLAGIGSTSCIDTTKLEKPKLRKRRKIRVPGQNSDRPTSESGIFIINTEEKVGT